MSKKKQKLLMVAPFGTRSGYGDHARDLFWSFYNLDRFDINCIDVPWGATPRNAISYDNPKDKILIDCMVSPNEIKEQPDICVDIRIPNEFNPVGKFNIGITAGVETTAVSQVFLEGCNKMDLVIVPSEHSKAGFVNSRYDKLQQMPDGSQQPVGQLKLEKPMEVLFEGTDLNVWKPLKKEEIEKNILDDINNIVKEKFAYLFVGQWCAGNYGEDRKDIARTVKVFYETFANKKNPPALILKTSGATYSILDREDTLNKLKQVKSKFPSFMKLPNVYLLHGDFTRSELNSLYNHPKVKAMVSFTHGEGFGRPMLEATLAGLPVIASGWSGQLDFLDKDKSVLVNGTMGKVPESVHWQDIIIPESHWFNVDEGEASANLELVYNNYNAVEQNAKELMDINRNKFSHDAMTVKLGEILDNHVNISSTVNLNLPKLKKVKTESEKPKIKLPQLS
mgnify:CR=1 FL=1|tara:strand:- start:319 stop:1671 length:1353 start_codon:yes stop_codon:yes gene_type:complete